MSIKTPESCFETEQEYQNAIWHNMYIKWVHEEDEIFLETGTPSKTFEEWDQWMKGE